MTTFKYDQGTNLVGTKQVDLTSAAMYALLVDNTYSPRQHNDNYVSDIPASAIIVRDLQILSPAVSQGMYTGSLAEIDSFLSSQTVAAIVLYIKGISDSVSPLFYYSSDGVGFPFLPQGFNYQISADLSIGGWFAP